MKIVSLVWFKIIPAKYGGQKGIAQFEEHLAKHFQLTCICSSDNEKLSDSGLKLLPVIPPGKKQFIDPFTTIKILRTIKKEKAELLLLEHPYHALIALAAKKTFNIHLVLHEHNIEYARFKQMEKWWWPVLKWIEKLACRHADLVLFKTEQDKTKAVEDFKLSTGKCIIVPYGVEEHKTNTAAKKIIYHRHQIPDQCKLILFAGTLDYGPNAKAVESIYKNLLPLLDENEFRIVVCGRNKFPEFQYLNELKANHFIMVGEVDTIEEYFEAADVFIDPVLYGGGIQTKILDALGYHLNVVAFENALKGIDCSLAEEKLFHVADNDWKCFVEEIKKAANTKKITPPAFFEDYSWDKAIKKAVERIRQL